MEYCTNHPYTIPVIIVIGPICWGIYELRQLRLALLTYKDNAQSLIKNINYFKDVSKDVTTNNLEDYPFILKLNTLIDKTNNVLR